MLGSVPHWFEVAFQYTVEIIMADFEDYLKHWLKFPFQATTAHYSSLIQ